MITALDKNTALVLIDLQKGILGTAVPQIQEALHHAAMLAQAFRKAHLPVILVKLEPAKAKWLHTRKDNNAGAAIVASAKSPGFSDIVDELHQQASDIVVTKASWSAFYDTTLEEELQKHKVTHIVLGGVSTSIGVEGTARAAFERGYNISFATDAMTDRSIELHTNSLQYLFPRMGEQGTTADIIEKLSNRV